MYRPDERPGDAGPDRLVSSRLHDFSEALPACPAAAPCDAELVSQAAALATVSEFDLFRAAWRSWHGSVPSERRVEPVFARFLHEREAPGYVRHFARRLLDAAAAGRFSPAAFGLEGYRRRDPLPDLSCRLSAEVLVCALIAVVVIAI